MNKRFRVWPFLLGATAFLFFQFGARNIFSGQKEVPFQLFFTSDISGYLKPCG
ncbi:MAG: hypothetical protein ACE5HO_03320 [bacterium]